KFEKNITRVSMKKLGNGLYKKNKCFEIKVIDLKNSDIELNKNLFNSYSNEYVPFDGRCYEDTCLQLIKAKIPNKYIKDKGMLHNFYGVDGTLKGIKHDFDEKEIIKEINKFNVNIDQNGKFYV
ncbi:MAG: hypothetical protein ACRC7R_12070, partial [Sarcina sp.]